MFFLASKLFSFLFDPLWLSLMLLALAGCLRPKRPKMATKAFFLGLAIIYFASTDLVVRCLMLPLELQYQRPARVPEGDAIVVLGGSVDLRHCTPGHAEMQAASDRFIDGVLLAKALPQATLIFSGGTAEILERGAREAPMLKELAMQLGVPNEQIVAEDKSRNTRENALEAQVILSQAGARRPILVTSAYHMPRAMKCFRKIGLDPIPYPTDFKSKVERFGLPDLIPSTNNLDNTNRAIREYVGAIMYRIKGYT